MGQRDDASTVESTPFDDGELYDLFLGEIPLGREFYVNLAKAAPGAVLDVACGTGRILLPCLQAGVDIVGVDLFPGMLDRLRAKAAALHLNPTLHQADMAEFKVPRRFALILIPFNAFLHNLTTEAQIACLRRCREHLQPEGQLVIDASFPSQKWIGAPTGHREMELEVSHPKTGLPMRMWDTRTFDRVQQIQYSFCEVEMLDGAGNIVRTIPSRTTIRWIYKGEMELLLRASGFARWEISGDFDGHPLTEENDMMIVRAWASPG